MMSRTKLSVLVLGLLAATSMLCVRSKPQQPQPYQGVSHPPADDMIHNQHHSRGQTACGQAAGGAVRACGSAIGRTACRPACDAASLQWMGHRMSSGAPATAYIPPAQGGTDDDIVHVARPAGLQAARLNARTSAYDPDGDIVHPRPCAPGELRREPTIRVRLLDRLSTAETEKGEPFRTRVATDVMQGGRVVIPAGSEIDGRVVEVSSGHAGGHGTMRLAARDGDSARWHALSAPCVADGDSGSRHTGEGEGTVQPGSRLKRDGIEYGGAVGAGVVTGAIVGGPVGALTGGADRRGRDHGAPAGESSAGDAGSGTTLMFMLTDAALSGS